VFSDAKTAESENIPLLLAEPSALNVSNEIVHIRPNTIATLLSVAK